MSETDVMQTWTTIPDKSKWGAGPWVDEPDKAQWIDEATGLVCLAFRHPHFGNWCGYVGVPSGHPWHGSGYDDDRINVEVHGGLTYADRCQEGETPVEDRICHIPEPGAPDDLWWFGYDCSHLGDLSPGIEARSRAMGLSWTGARRDVYRTLEYVQAECADLAKQLAVARSGDSR